MKTRRHGYLMIDHRASPGTAEVPEGTMREVDYACCAHCGGYTMLNPDRKRPRGHCRKCDAYVCDEAACQLRSAMEHVPYKQIIDRAYEAQQRKTILP